MEARPPTWSLSPGDTIRRVTLHDQYGGSRQGGMTRSTSTPNLFLFTDPVVGHQHGYFDGWVGDRFHYTGMGQRGDQEFVAGNAALLAHAAEGRAVRLFRGSGGAVTYLGEFVLDSETPWYRTDAPETGGQAIRQVIVFRLLPRGEFVRDPQDELQPPGELPAADIEAALVGGAEVVATEVPVEEQYTERAVVEPG